MRLRCSASTLAAAISAASVAVRSEDVIRIEVSGGVARITGADAEISVTVSIDAGDGEDGSALCHAKPVAAYASALDAAVMLDLAAEGPQLSVTGDGRVYRFSVVEGAYATVERPGDGAQQTDAGRVGDLYAAVRHAVDPRMQLVKLSAGEGSISMYATDSYRLAAARVGTGDSASFSALFPTNGLAVALRHQPETLLIDPRGRIAAFSGGGIETVVRLGAAEFPAVEKVVAEHGGVSWGVRSADLLRALQRIAAVAGNEPLRCEIGESELRISGTSSEGSGVEYLQVEGEGSGSFGVAAKNLIDAVTATKAERVLIHYSDPKRPLHLAGTTEHGCDVVCVVMPVVWGQ